MRTDTGYYVGWTLYEGLTAWDERLPASRQYPPARLAIADTRYETLAQRVAREFYECERLRGD